MFIYEYAPLCPRILAATTIINRVLIKSFMANPYNRKVGSYLIIRWKKIKNKSKIELYMLIYKGIQIAFKWRGSGSSVVS